MQNSEEIKNKKVVFITGGSRGIGKAIVQKFASKDYTVCFTYNNSDKSAIELENLYQNVKSYKCEISDYDNVCNVASEVLKKYKKVDILVNNAGITKDKSFLKMDKVTWDKVIDVNLKAIFNFSHNFLSGMVENKWGRIINISSIIGLKGGFGQTNYAASKAGIIGFTKALALEVASKGVTVNALAPGFIETDMTKDIPEEVIHKIKETIPAGKLGKTVEIADLIYYLGSKESGYMTGQVLSINGGLY